PEAKARGYGPGRFSFNVKGGRCEACEGDGVIKIEMHFLPDVYVQCDVCKGKRYNRETLEVEFKGKSIADVLDMTVEEGATFFSAVPSIREKLATLERVGLGYIHIGQPATTLSGGEAQRVKLAKELARRATGRTLYILDEPTTGLHFADVSKLLEVLHALVDQGNTMLVIEHNLEVIKTADWIVDLGPEGGSGGGRIVASGTPEQIAAAKGSYTGDYLKAYLARNSEKKRKRA
ncbi:MAG: ATP-binding cassette domain-containing protein, partial [Stellaceae bacterium]